MSSRRVERVARQILQAVSSLVETELADPRIGLVTFTGATISPDLRQARIYYSALGDEEAKRSAADGLTHASGYLRREVGRRLGLRFSPTLHFEPDRSLERADRGVVAA